MIFWKYHAHVLSINATSDNSATLKHLLQVERFIENALEF